MTFEMSCPHCEGRMMVDALGIVVSCPHCGSHLAIPADIPGQSDHTTGEKMAPEDALQSNGLSDWIPGSRPEDSSASFPAHSQDAGTEHDLAASESNILVSEPDHEPEVPSALRVDNPDLAAVKQAIVANIKPTESAVPLPHLSESEKSSTAESSDSPPAPDSNIAALANLSTESATAHADSLSGFLTGVAAQEMGASQLSGNSASGLSDWDSAPSDPGVMENTDQAFQGIGPTPTKYESTHLNRRGKVIPTPLFLSWCSYTILISAGLAWAMYRLFFVPIASNLESLPDVKPLEENERKLVPEKAAMPRGHTLVLNQTQRFGNIEVTPLRVTEGDLVLEGREYLPKSQRMENAGTVLKLWLRFKNVSADQSIAPLDENLLFYRHKSKEQDVADRANHFVCRADDKSQDGNLVLLYDIDAKDDYEIQDYPIGTELKPGEELEIYIPTESYGWEQLQGPLIWRVHFRKGYSPKNYGVTTVIEVAFPSEAIEPESESA